MPLIASIVANQPHLPPFTISADASCIRYNNVVTGPERYVEITCLYPQLSLITSDWESSPEVNEWIVNVHEYTKEHVYLPAYICAFYFAAVIVGPKIVAGRKVSEGVWCAGLSQCKIDVSDCISKSQYNSLRSFNSRYPRPLVGAVQLLPLPPPLEPLPFRLQVSSELVTGHYAGERNEGQ